MKQNFTILMATIFLLGGNLMNAQQFWMIPNESAGINPGELNADAEYPQGGGLPTGWTQVLATGVPAKWSTNKTLPFVFKFNGKSFSSYKISNSGVLTFTTAATAVPAFGRVAYPNAAIPSNSICVTGLGSHGTNDLIMTKTFGTAPNRQVWLHFNSYGYGTTASDGSNYCYWSIVLEETTNRIHIVDQRTGGYATTKLVSIGLQLDSVTAVMVPGSPDVESKAGFDPTPVDNTFYTFVPGAQGKYDVTIKKVSTSQYQIQGDIKPSGTFRNLGSSTITSLNLNYITDLGNAVTEKKTGLNIAPFEVFSLDHNTPWKITTGNHFLEMYVDNINGNVDENPSDDKKTKTIFCMERYEQRLPLFEIYSSSTCPPCKPANETYKAIIDTKDPATFVNVKFQQDFPGVGDPYCTTEAVNRRGYYAINSIPRTEIDGGWDGNGNSFTDEIFEESRKVPAFYSLKGDYKIEGKKVTAKVKFQSLFDSPGAKLYVAVIEKTTIANVASNLETEFHSVMKKMLPTEAGTTLKPLGILASDSMSFTYTFNGDYRLPVDGQAANRINHATEHSVEEFEDMYVVAWIQGNDKQVFQAANLTASSTTGVNDGTASFDALNIYPNPTTDAVSVKLNVTKPTNVLSTIVDNAGNIVCSKSARYTVGNNVLEYNVSDLPQGLYHVMIFDEKNNASVLEFVKQ